MSSDRPITYVKLVLTVTAILVLLTLLYSGYSLYGSMLENQQYVITYFNYTHVVIENLTVSNNGFYPINLSIGALMFEGEDLVAKSFKSVYLNPGEKEKLKLVLPLPEGLDLTYVKLKAVIGFEIVPFLKVQANLTKAFERSMYYEEPAQHVSRSRLSESPSSNLPISYLNYGSNRCIHYEGLNR